MFFREYGYNIQYHITLIFRYTYRLAAFKMEDCHGGYT